MEFLESIFNFWNLFLASLFFILAYTWTTKTSSDIPEADHINRLQDLKLDKDGEIAWTGTSQWKKGSDVSVASGGDLALGSDGNYFDVLNDLSIMTITPAQSQPGTPVCLHFGMSLDIIHDNDDIVIPGGSNLTVAAGSEAVFIEYTTGKFRLVSLQATAPAPSMKDVREYADFSTAISSIGATECTLLIPNEQSVSTDETVPSTMTLRFLQGGSLNIDSGKTVTINQQPQAGLYQIFKGSGDVSFGGGFAEIYPEWFGVVADGTTDDSTALQEAINKAAEAGATLRLPNATIYYTTGLSVPGETTIKGHGVATSILEFDGGIGENAITLGTSTSGGRFLLKDFRLVGASGNNCNGIQNWRSDPDYAAVVQSQFSNIQIRNFNNEFGIEIDGSWMFNFHRVDVETSANGIKLGENKVVNVVNLISCRTSNNTGIGVLLAQGYGNSLFGHDSEGNSYGVKSEFQNGLVIYGGYYEENSTADIAICETNSAIIGGGRYVSDVGIHIAEDADSEDIYITGGHFHSATDCIKIGSASATANRTTIGEGCFFDTVGTDVNIVSSSGLIWKKIDGEHSSSISFEKGDTGGFNRFFGSKSLGDDAGVYIKNDSVSVKGMVWSDNGEFVLFITDGGENFTDLNSTPNAQVTAGGTTDGKLVVYNATSGLRAWNRLGATHTVSWEVQEQIT